jgi:hypothetical protein
VGVGVGVGVGLVTVIVKLPTASGLGPGPACDGRSGVEVNCRVGGVPLEVIPVGAVQVMPADGSERLTEVTGPGPSPVPERWNL